AFVSTLDLLPTFARLVETPAPVNLDGFDQLDLILGKADARSPRRTLFSLYGYKARRLESMREGRWKLHLLPKPMLFDLQTDVGEKTDVSAQHPDIVEKLTQAEKTIRDATLGSP
ncbi:MAG TPA: hypothetical protein PLB55_19805, partial [Prosthecobacter sp.]|nr:hypothetical protein [Prosthecobacter sp.]